ncbi:RecBCD enzyme subunit RecB [Actinomycetes bacterium]|nr:RecBCD enzyme subunit RecB [Actinomycetes bacterium]
MSVVYDDFNIVDPKLENGTVIEASAGTGKTYSVASIVTRAIAMNENIRIGNVLVTTFTRNAAAELRDRIRRRIVSTEAQLREGVALPGDHLAGSLLGPDQLERAARLARALREFDTATIATIHAVCARILTTAGLPSAGGTGDVDVRDVIEEVVNDAVIWEANLNNVYDPSRLAAVVEARLAAPLSVLGYETAAVKRNEIVPITAEVKAERDHVVEVIESCVSRVRERMVNQPTFDDMLRRAAEVLADKSQVALVAALRQKYLLAVIDEAQDTDKLQWSIFQSIFPDSSKNMLLAVGDPKQAIYRFRGADIDAYLSVREDEKLLTLRENWRSDDDLIAALNHLFDGWEFGTGINYIPVKARTGAPKSSIVGVKPLSIISLGAVTNKTRIVRPTALRVREILENVQIATSGKTRAVKPGDICVLVTSRNTGASVESALREMGVSAVSSGTENVMQGEMATAIYNLLRAMDEPYETSRIRLAAASPFFGASLATAGALDDETVEQIRRTISLWGSTLRRRGVAALAASLRADLEIAARIVQGSGGERRETDFAHVIELLHSATLGVGCTPAEVLNSFKDFSQLEPQSEIISRRVESDKDAVQIMTVHAAKGLEFPIVVVADLWKTVRAKNPKKPSPDAFYRDSPTNPGEREHVIDATYVLGSDLFSEAKEGRKQEESDEVKRLFYVALTRARHHVSLIVADDDPAKKTKTPRIVEGLAEPARFQEVSDVAEVVKKENIQTYPKYVSVQESKEDFSTAPFAGSVQQTYSRLSFSGITKNRKYKQVENLNLEGEARGGYGDDAESEIISMRSGYSDKDVALLATPDPMPLAHISGGTYFGKVMHTVYEHIDFTVADLPSEVARVVDAYVTGSLLREHRQEIIDGVVLSLRTPLGGLIGPTTLSEVSSVDRLNELNFEMGLAALSHGVMVNNIGKVLVHCLERDDRFNDVLMPYARVLASDAFAVPLYGLMNGSIDTLIRFSQDAQERLFITDWKSNRLDEDGMAYIIDGYSRESMVNAMEHHHYPLQALIYGTAVHRYLRSRAGSSKSLPVIAGMAYFFIRGMVGEPTPMENEHRHGVFTWEAPQGLWQELSDEISGAGK